MLRRCLVLVCLLGLVGCSDRPANPPSDSKVNFNAPGVNIEVNKEKGKVEVNAPGVKVKVTPQ
jgi:hypothetical protein